MAELKPCLFELKQGDCMEYMKEMKNESVNLILTDIPYNEVNRESNGLRNLDKEKADVMTFVLSEFLDEVYRVCKGTIIIFCGKEQLSEIHRYFADKQKKQKGTVRQLIWRKTNPSPMNGQHIYLSGIENAVWFKKRGSSFNAHCKHNVFNYPCGRSKLHPTEKNHDLIKDLILDNSNEGDLIFDPCAGSGNLLAAAIIAGADPKKVYYNEYSHDIFEIGKKRLMGLGVPEKNFICSDALSEVFWDFLREEGVIKKLKFMQKFGRF
jgi:DNA modification methylase